MPSNLFQTTFKKGCTNTTAEGRAWVKNIDNSILKVSFACILDVCIEAAAGEYYVLALGPINGDGLYAWALVGEPTREFGWILSRTMALPARVMAEIEKKIVEQGDDPANFNMTHQD